VNRWNDSLFRAAALASGLVEQRQVDDALASLAVAIDSPDASAAPLKDEALVEKMIELGHLNRWQAEQLKAGRTRFRLGDYQVVDSIGQGGMGQVFKAVHTLLGRVEAIKVLPRDRSTPDAIDRFRREIRVMAQLDHPNLVRISYAGFDGDVYFLVAEYVPGADLRRLVRSEGPLPMQRAAALVAQAAEALQYVHDNGLMHRDVKPGNVLVTADGVAKLSDLGLSCFANDSIDDDPHAGKVVGTADYIAPEVVLSPREASGQSDLYSLGCTLYYAATGKVPFPGGTAKEKAHRHCTDAPLHPRHFNSNLNDAFVDVIADMMEKDPARRIAAAKDVIHRLAPWIGETAPVGRIVAEARRGAAPPLPPPPGARQADSDVFHFPDSSTPEASQGTPALDDAREETVVDFIDVQVDGDAVDAQVVDARAVDSQIAANHSELEEPLASFVRFAERLLKFGRTTWRRASTAGKIAGRVGKRLLQTTLRTAKRAWSLALSIPPAVVIATVLAVAFAAAAIYWLVVGLGI
jgi:serine/threonine protein kinase